MNIPLRPLYGGFLHEIFFFLSVLMGRLVDYLAITRDFFGISLDNVKFSSQRTKKALLRLLMRRQATFNAHPRVTMATVSVGLFLTLIPLNIDIQAEQGFFDIRNANDTTVAPSALIASARVGVRGEESLPSINEVVTHTIAPGDTLSALSQQYLVPSDAIAYVNNISVNTLLRPGDTLTIPPIQGLTHKVTSGETVASIADKYNVSPQTIVDANVLKPPFNIFGGDVLVVPGGEVPKPAPVVRPVLAAVQTAPPVSGGLSLQTVPGSGGYIMPTGGKITQYASYYHMALDIARGCGDEIWAAQSGTVVYSGWRAGGYGFMVELNHPDGRVSQYAHMSRTAVSVGQTVSQGQVIGYTGATGIAYGCHLHFVVQSGGRAINPLDVL